MGLAERLINWEEEQKEVKRIKHEYNWWQWTIMLIIIVPWLICLVVGFLVGTVVSMLQIGYEFGAAFPSNPYEDNK